MIFHANRFCDVFSVAQCANYSIIHSDVKSHPVQSKKFLLGFFLSFSVLFIRFFTRGKLVIRTSFKLQETTLCHSNFNPVMQFQDLALSRGGKVLVVVAFDPFNIFDSFFFLKEKNKRQKKNSSNKFIWAWPSCSDSVIGVVSVDTDSFVRQTEQR